MLYLCNENKETIQIRSYTKAPAGSTRTPYEDVASTPTEDAAGIVVVVTSTGSVGTAPNTLVVATVPHPGLPKYDRFSPSTRTSKVQYFDASVSALHTKLKSVCAEHSSSLVMKTYHAVYPNWFAALGPHTPEQAKESEHCAARKPSSVATHTASVGHDGSPG